MAAVDETLFAEMKRYVRFDEADTKALAALLPNVSRHFDRIVAEFYERIREHEGAHDVFTSEEQVERLKRSLTKWLDRVLRGPHDEAYFLESSKIGRMHVRVGLPQHYMFTAMALIRTELLRLAEETMGGAASIGTRDAVNRALDLELAIMLESYRTDLVARLKRADEIERASVDRGTAKTEWRYRHAVEMAPVLIVGLDAEGSIRLFNAEAEATTGFGREEVNGLSFVSALLPEELRSEHGAMFAAAALGTETRRVLDSAICTKAGKLRDVRWVLAYASDKDDEIVLFAVGQDTTDQNALAGRVRQSEKLAAVGTLAAGLAHEIRNPLNGAHLHVTFLERGLKRAGFSDSETLEAVRVVGEEIKRLSALVTEFLDFARPKPLTKKPTSIKALCDRCTQLAAPDAALAGVKLVSDLPIADVSAEIDGPKTEQVLLNLVRNAIDAMAPGGGGVVVLRARRQPRNVVIEVEDQGPGLSNPEAPIFDPFYSTKPQGTGLGLAIVHRIVTDHDGTITVSSKPGKTVFRVTFPLHLGDKSA